MRCLTCTTICVLWVMAIRNEMATGLSVSSHAILLFSSSVGFSLLSLARLRQHNRSLQSIVYIGANESVTNNKNKALCRLGWVDNKGLIQ
jgi:hypothetical protein